MQKLWGNMPLSLFVKCRCRRGRGEEREHGEGEEWEGKDGGGTGERRGREERSKYREEAGEGKEEENLSIGHGRLQPCLFWCTQLRWSQGSAPSTAEGTSAGVKGKPTHDTCWQGQDDALQPLYRSVPGLLSLWWGLGINTQNWGVRGQFSSRTCIWSLQPLEAPLLRRVGEMVKVWLFRSDHIIVHVQTKQQEASLPVGS